MFQTAEASPRFLESRAVRFGLAASFFAATSVGFALLTRLARIRPDRELFLLGSVFSVLVVTGSALLWVYRAYTDTRERLVYVKLYAHDILQCLSIGVVTSDLDGRVTNLNERARELADVGGDAAQRPYREVLAHVPPLVAAIDRLLSEGVEFSALDVERPVGANTLSLRLDGRFLLNDRGERIGAILQIHDVSALKLLDQEIRRTEKLAGLGTLAAGIAHEIKNPLAALSIHAQLLEEGAGAAKSGKYLKVIQSEVRRLQSIVDKYVAFARPRPLEHSDVSLESVLDSILALVEPECRKRKIAVRKEGALADPARYRLDEGQVQQALLNIAINAIQAMETGGTLTCRLGRADRFATVEIADTGPGIPPEVRGRLFDLFFTTRQGGTGLGLYIAQRVVAEHKGYIDVRTGPGGSTFIVGLPAKVTA